jgi:ankyrin repeat protein
MVNANDIYEYILYQHKFDLNTINSTNPDGSTALHNVLHPGYARFDQGIIQNLIENGANVNAVDNYGNTPLHIYSRSDDINTKIVEDLLNHGANINATNNEGKTPLHIYAAKEDGGEDITIFRYFIEHGARVNAVDNYGQTPLHYYVYHGNGIHIFKYFIEHGAKIDIKDQDGTDVVQLALARVRPESEDDEDDDEDEDFNKIYNYLLSVQKGKKVTQEILYIPPKESFKGGKEYLKGLKRWNKANNFGKKKNKFASDLKYLQKLK